MTGPYRITDRDVPLRITGYFMPTVAPSSPVLAAISDTDDLFILVFATEGKLRAAMKNIGIDYERVAIVRDGRELIEEINTLNASGGRPYRIRLAVDPYKAENDRVRFVEPLTEATS